MPTRGKRIQFDAETYTVLKQLADDRMANLQELADEAFSLLLKKYGRPVGIKAQLQASVAPREKMPKRPDRKARTRRSK